MFVTLCGSAGEQLLYGGFLATFSNQSCLYISRHMPNYRSILETENIIDWTTEILLSDNVNYSFTVSLLLPHLLDKRR